MSSHNNPAVSVERDPLQMDIILHDIFSKLTDNDLCRSGQVCKKWASVSSIVRRTKRHDGRPSIRVLSVGDILATPLYTLASQLFLHVGEYAMIGHDEMPTGMLARRLKCDQTTAIQSVSELDDDSAIQCPIDLIIGQGDVENTLAMFKVVSDLHLKFGLPLPYLVCLNFGELSIAEMDIALLEHSHLEIGECSNVSPLFRTYEVLSTLPEIDDVVREQVLAAMPVLPRTLTDAVGSDQETTAIVESIAVLGEVDVFWNQNVVLRPEGVSEVYANEVDAIFGFQPSYTDICDLDPPQRFSLFRTGIPVQELRDLLAPLANHFSRSVP